MQHRRALAGSAMAIMVIAATTIAIQPGQTEEAAAKECLSKPGAPGPAGTWWYYRIDRSTKQRCWYLGEKSEKSKTRTARAERRSESGSEPPQRTRKSRAREDVAEAPAPQRPSAAPTVESEMPPARNNDMPPARNERFASRGELPSARMETRTAQQDELDLARSEMSSMERADTGSAPTARANRSATAMLATVAPTLPALPGTQEPEPTSSNENVDRDSATFETQGDTPPVSAATPEAHTAAVFQKSDSTPGFGHVLLFVLTAAAFAAVAVYAIMKLRRAWLDRQLHLETTAESDAPQTHPPIEQSSERIIGMMRSRSARSWQKPAYAVAGDSAERIPYDEAHEAPALRRLADGLRAGRARQGVH